MADAPGKVKVAILGGGAGALTAAFGLTDSPGGRDRYEITVYQLGWRLGGKGASGRNPDHQQRIEEHGLHVWAGFYDNAFRIMRACYDELKRPHGSPLATVEDAFEPTSFVTIAEYLKGRWIDWNITMPVHPGTPGDPGEIPSPWECVRRLIDWMLQKLDESPHAPTIAARSTGVPARPEWVHVLVRRVETALRDVAAEILTTVETVAMEAAAPVPEAPSARDHLERASKLAHAVGEDPAEHPIAVHHGLIGLMDSFRASLACSIGDQLEWDDEARRLWIVLDLAAAHVRGILADGVLVKGFSAIDGEDWSAWLRRHGASELAVTSAIVRSTYDYIFGYKDGDVARPWASAGICINGMLRLLFTYKGAYYYKMQAGMGDTVFAPLYQVLKRRGVKFAFFHRVTNLGLSPDQGMISTLTLARQVTLKGAEYHPLVDVKGLPCWPSCPLYDQIVEGPQLKAQGIDLESAWTTWKDVEEVTLHLGRDFDLVILGISVGALPRVAAELVAASPAWRRMVDQVGTVPTRAVQLWFDRDAKALGWSGPPPVGSAYAEPLADWADMTHLVPREDWPDTLTPRYLAYFCGAYPDPDPPAPFHDPSFPQRQKERVAEGAIAWLRQNAAHLWPHAMTPSGDFDWQLLTDPQDRVGVERFQAQYVRVNVNPSDRYVLSAPGSTASRLGSGGSGLSNLFLAGDWVATPISAGCVEAAVMAGLQASRAISGYPETISGEDGWDD